MKIIKLIIVLIIVVTTMDLDQAFAQSLFSSGSGNQGNSGGFSFSSIVPPDPINQKIYSMKSNFVKNDKLLIRDPLLGKIFGGGNNSDNNSGSENNSNILATAGIVGGVMVGANMIGQSGENSSGSNTSTQEILNVPFGGKLITTITCTCTSNFLLFIQDYRTKSNIQIIYQPGVSRLNQHYNFMTPGVSVLGTYLNLSMQCLVYSGTSCTTFGSPQGMVSPTPFPGMGTSAI